MTASLNSLSSNTQFSPCDDLQTTIVGQAIEWHMRLQADDVNADDKSDFESWLNQNADHAQAYQRIQTLWQKFDDIEPKLIKPVLEANAQTPDFLQSDKSGKKTFKKSATALSLLIIGMLVYQQQKPEQLWLADYQTKIGEQRTLNLPDSSTLTLNTNTIVELDYTNKERRILLKQGELFIKVAKDHKRPLIVSTKNATARALGTQFMVQVLPQNVQYQTHPKQFQTKVTVVESQVETCASLQWYQIKSNCITLSAGDSTTIAQQTIAAKEQANVEGLTGWVSGKLVFDNQPLSVVIEELQHYSTAALELSSPTLKDLRVSGVFPAQNTARSLELLASRLPIQIKHTGQDIIISTR